MKKVVMLGILLMFAGNALATVLCEGFDDPLQGWRDRWLAQNSDMRNYYVCYGGGGENDRGNNPCGLWICDGDANPMQADVEFNPSFGAGVCHFELGIMPFVPAHVTMLQSDGTAFFDAELVVDGGFPPCPTRVYGGDCVGLLSFSISPTGGSQIEGNTSVDNVCATVDCGVPVHESTWGSIKATYR
jgi:hypothetical protein